ncbi:head decoration protein [Thioclava sp. A2]|uniref:head decoration protein n=1 Tax=Thioclava sp. FCG-A2 TaxID=3080562 RepID=UPI0029540746|nr:head decoration protein [Thioclava sp. A2]MDV7272077.1 head decoration protein [Thioclava sp. A2]
MANTIQLKRRVSGVAGAPAALKSGELAHNEVDDTLYVGKGDDGAGNATSVVPMAGSGGFLALVGTQTVAGAKTFSLVPKSSQDASAATDLVRKSQLDAGLATKAALSHAHVLSDVTGLQTALDAKLGTSATAVAANKLATARTITLAGDLSGSVSFDGSANITLTAAVADDSHAHVIANVDGLQAALDAKAPLASPALTGTPSAPTAITGTSTTQLATTAFVQEAIVAFGPGDMLKSTYDADGDGKVDAAEVADAAPWAGITGKPTSFPPSAHAHAMSDVTGLQAALDAKAPLASPAFTGAPTAPTATAGTNTAQIATTGFVAAAIAALIDAAPGALDTLNELAAALGDDPNFASTVTNALAGKLSAASNLSDLPNVVTARANLGLGTMAVQNAASVAITGGTISGIALDGGTF